MLSTALLLALTAAPKPDAKLAGTWTLSGAPFMTLNANGTGTMDDGAVKWGVDGSTLVVTDDEGGVDKLPFALRQDALTLTLEGVAVTLVRASKSDAAAPKPGKLGRKLAAQADDGELDAPPTQLQVQVPGLQVQVQGGQRQGQPQAAPRAAGNDQLSQLLVSSAWCHLRYNQAAGTSHTTKIRFNPNGTWSDFSEHDIYIANNMGSAQSTSNAQSSGQWAVKGGQLYLSNPPETPSLELVHLSITRNSNGYPIITADGREYSMCN